MVQKGTPQSDRSSVVKSPEILPPVLVMEVPLSEPLVASSPEIFPLSESMVTQRPGLPTPVFLTVPPTPVRRFQEQTQERFSLLESSLTKKFDSKLDVLTELVHALTAPKTVPPQFVVLEPPQLPLPFVEEVYVAMDPPHLPLPSVEEVYVEFDEDSQTSSPSTVRPPDHQIVPYLEEGKLAISLSKTSRALAAVRRATSRVSGTASTSGNQPKAESDLLSRS